MKTIKVELNVNCPYGKIGDIVEVAEDTSKAYGNDMKKTNKDLTKDVDSIVSDVENTKTQADIEAEEKAAQEKKELKNKETKEVKTQETK